MKSHGENYFDNTSSLNHQPIRSTSQDIQDFQSPTKKPTKKRRLISEIPRNSECNDNENFDNNFVDDNNINNMNSNSIYNNLNYPRFNYDGNLSLINFKSVFILSKKQLDKLSILFKFIVDKLLLDSNNLLYYELIYVLPLLFDKISVEDLENSENLRIIIDSFCDSYISSDNNRSKSPANDPKFVKIRAKRLVNSKEIGKALAKIEGHVKGDQSVNQISQPILEDVKKFFPDERAEDLLPMFADSSLPVQISEEAIKFTLGNLSSSSAAGLSPWTFSLIRKLSFYKLDEISLFDSVASFINILANTKIHFEGFFNCKLLLIRKANGKLRPIGIPDSWYRVIAKLMVDQYSPFFDNGNIQFGVKVKGGTENIVHQIQNSLTNNPSFSVITFDVSNAFNSIFRSSFYNECNGDLKSFVHKAYNSPRKMGITINNKTFGVIEASGGTIQGDPLSPLLFSMALTPTLRKLQDEFSEIRIFAYLDDVVAIGAPHLFEALQHRLTSLLSKLGLTINTEKTQVLHPDSNTGLDLLGIPFGPDSFIGTSLNNSLKDICNLLNFVDTLEAPIAYPIIQQGIQGKITHLIRQLPPSSTFNFTSLVDKRFHQSIISLTDFKVSKLSPISTILSNLPVKLGGLGFFNFQSIAPLAWSSSILSSLQLPELSANSLEIVGNTLSEFAIPIAPISQKELSTFLHRRNHDTLLKMLSPEPKAFHLASLDQGAAIWLNCGLTSSPTLQLSDPVFRRMVALRLFMDPPSLHPLLNATSSQHTHNVPDSNNYNSSSSSSSSSSNCPFIYPDNEMSMELDPNHTPDDVEVDLSTQRIPSFQCSHCKSHVTNRAIHGLLCSRNKEARVRRHTHIRTLTVEFLSRIFGPEKVHTEVELLRDPSDPNKYIRADIVVDVGVNHLLLDVTIPCSAAAPYLAAGSSTDPLRTVNMAEKEKIAKYAPYLTASNLSSSVFFPLVFEASGRIGPSVNRLQTYLSKLDRPTVKVDNVYSAYRFYLQRARTALNRANGNMLRLADQYKVQLATRSQ